MERIDTLEQYRALLEIRRKAARRNGIVLTGIFLAIAAVAVWLLRSEYKVDWVILQYGFLVILLVFLVNMQLVTETLNKGMLDLITTLQRDKE